MKKSNKILILHGWQANSRSNWFPEAKEFFESKGNKVFIPNSHGGYSPRLEDWLKEIEKLKPDADWILIGHSLGGTAILHFLEKTEKPVAKTVLLAVPINEMKFTPIKNFFGRFDWEKIKKTAGKINLIYELDDQIVPLEHGHILAGKLAVPLVVLPGATHLTKLDLKTLERVING